MGWAAAMTDLVLVWNDACLWMGRRVLGTKNGGGNDSHLIYIYEPAPSHSITHPFASLGKERPSRVVR